MSWHLSQFIAQSEVARQPAPKAPRGIIYRITNWATKQVYIGKTKNTFAKRYTAGNWWKHTHCAELKRDYAQHGPEAFEVDILASDLTHEELIMAETFLIASHNCLQPRGYNKLVNTRGSVVSDETRQRMSAAHKGKVVSEATRLALSKAKKGKPSPLRGVPKSPEHIAKMRLCQMGGKHHAARQTQQIDLSTQSVLNTYSCAADAARALGLNDNDIQSTCRGRRRQCGGFGWRYAL